VRRRLPWFLLSIWLVAPGISSAQGLTGTIVGTVSDQQGAVLVGATVRLSSPSLIGGSWTQLTNPKGQLNFPALPPGVYAIDISLTGFRSHAETGIDVGAGMTRELRVVLPLAGVSESLVVEAVRPRLDPRNPGFATIHGPADLLGTPTRRFGMFDPIRATPGISPSSPGASPAGGTSVTSVSAFGSGTGENIFLIDDTNTTCPCNGVSRSEPSIDFIQAIHVQTIGASAEYGNVQGAVINVITRQGSGRLLYDAGFYLQTAGLTSQPVLRPYGTAGFSSGYERDKYRDFTTNLGGPAVRDRLWFFAGYQRVRDYDSQPGTDPAYPRTYEQDKALANLTWRLGQRWRLIQSLQYEAWVSPEQPTAVKPWETTQRRHATVPVVTFGNLTHVVSDQTIWEVRVGRFVHDRIDDPSSGVRTTVNRQDTVTKVWSGGPAQLGRLTLRRTSAKTILTHYQAGLWGADHQWKVGGQFERGEGDGYSVIPTGVRYEDSNGQPSLAISADPSVTGGRSITAGAFATDAITIGNRLTVMAGVRFDHSRAISQDLPAIDVEGRETGAIIAGRGTLYTWNIVSPRLGLTLKLSRDGRTMLRGSYGRFSQGVLTGEFSGFHPGVAPTTTSEFDPVTGEYTLNPRVDDPRSNFDLDPGIQAPRTDEYSAGVDREIGRGLSVTTMYVHKRGTSFIGFTDIGGQYREDVFTRDGITLPVYTLVNSTADRVFRLTNPPGYSLTYNGIVLAAEKRRSNGWQASASYTWSKTEGLQASSGATASAPQSSTVALPTVPIGRDPNSLTNARGRLPNDRPHIFRVMSAVDVPHTGVLVAAQFQHFSGKPWAGTVEVPMKQGRQRILVEPRGSRRLSSQTLLDLRLSRPFQIRHVGRLELLLDVLNALNDTAEEDLASDNLFATNFGQPTVFMDPRRAMLGVRLNIGAR
jgi:hypothetical protein